MNEKDELIRRIKNLAIEPIAYRNGHELLKLMDYYNVTSLSALTYDQVKNYWYGVLMKGF